MKKNLTEEELRSLPFGEIESKDRTSLQSYAYHLSRGAARQSKGFDLSKSDEIALGGEWFFNFRFDPKWFSKFVDKLVPEGSRPQDVIKSLIDEAMDEN